MRSNAASSMQKTYDECYLMCSTAVYFEGQNNEEEALRSWRSALEAIYYHNAHRIPSKYVPKSETEKALQESLRQLEIQCRERVDLLGALRESRKEAKEKNNRTSPDGGKPGVLSKGKAVSRSPGTPSTPGWIGEGTIPAVGYTDLSKPPTFPGRPPPVSKPSTDSLSNEDGNGIGFGAAPATSSPAFRVQSNSSGKTKSRNSSPERRKPMPTTLRSSDPKKQAKKKKKDSPNSKRKEMRPAASQAAGLAWGSIYRSPSYSEKTPSDAALVSSRITASSDPGFRKEQPASGDELLMRRKGRGEAADDRVPRNLRKPRGSDAARHLPTKASAPATTTHSPAGPRPQVGNRHKSSSFSTSQPKDAIQPTSSPKPSVKPKPVALRSSNPSRPVSGSVSNGVGSPIKPPRSGWPADSSNKPPNESKSQSKVTPSIGKPSYVSNSSGSGDDGLNRSMDRMSVSHGGPRRKPVAKPRVTPPSSDQESPGPKSTDDETDNEEEDEDDAIMDIMNKLPKGVDTAAARQILNDIVVRGDEVHWDDIAGLEGAKKALKEAVVYPFLRPDLFSGLREPARGMLLFGPPGTGKTMLARAVATESKSTFFSVSASTLTSKWHGESEKLVRALFGLAKALAPSIIFVDEIDSLLSSRSSGSENEASRRSKTEFLIQWSDLQRAAAGREQPSKEKKMGDASRVLVLAATNMPWDIDEAARRRFVRRQYIPLPEHHVREQQLRKLLSHQVHELSDADIEALVEVTEGFSGSDITALAKDAAMGPLRNLGEALLHTPMDQIRPIEFKDFNASLSSIRPSVSQEGLREYEQWAKNFGERGG
ncbi:hypothetical protein ASPWEDRAFT_22519 [Aspergillus wentii DTO 134E9]|uniref:AAA+ ATPase domain-containing protein n=1 Tax=Aspergillus wentii DTO 134E9 TaxID=1073089 RepID=A0A1L9RZP9_ASPWE|nr:uncharacterized protein ASPWEDRAFT_22519 [Aspergillus wentii DTO 134E9]OJJ40327.1 hypothetical protein ASPWEDRAFT_22519 [Aspergillus wentii DTO 134E9]